MFKNLKIGARLGLGFGVVLVLLCFMAAVAAWQMSRLADTATSYAVNLVPSYEVEHEIALALSDMRRLENRHILLNTDAALDEAEAGIADKRKTIAASLERYAKDLVSDDENRRAMEAVKSALDAYYKEWEAVRLRAVILAEASNLLQLPGRRVAAQPFASDGPGVLSSAAIQRQLDRDRTVFNALAVALRSASLAVAAAAKAQDAGAMQRAGESLDAACEACHTVNWYPRQVIPALPPKPPEL